MVNKSINAEWIHLPHKINHSFGEVLYPTFLLGWIQDISQNTFFWIAIQFRGFDEPGLFGPVLLNLLTLLAS